MKKTKTFCIYAKTKAQIIFAVNSEADQLLCFRYMDSTIPLLSKSKQTFQCLTISCACTARFVSDQVENPEDRFFSRPVSYMFVPMKWVKSVLN